ncbi:hypothetical protein KXD93_21575 [Mucilaginibacter sp. BJC16-A38]|uniref:P-loop NTPase fold protein n=1 Tax=Mucilaginibacter phenanthrenivorans TaxID=1234842 RepID=UPI0021582364|nr:P-loop NTPase fold protein [Mucilaginibacter phenanthrenivorans]MCR8560257.1 hypothetical protein [Mucilaginibacter phenanthrenivorans]
MVLEPNNISHRAVEVLKMASSISGIKATSELKDNYNSLWARDASVTGLAIIANQLSELYAPLKTSLINLQRAASSHGQIPSNIQINEFDIITKVSFGGPVGRVDASFWWIIASVLFLEQDDRDAGFKDVVYNQCETIFNLAESWEFNGKGLMYVPMSSNWADEYITNGYVLYDQLLRYWALLVSSEFFDRADWAEKALQIKVSIKQHYLFEAELNDSLYTVSQQLALKDFDIRDSFVASFSPGEYLEVIDSWSIALLLLLKIPSEASVKKLERVVTDLLNETDQKGVPAFWPVITEDSIHYKTLASNHNFQFKNKPGHFHNGGIWPVVNGFLVAGFKSAGLPEIANRLMEALDQQIGINLTENPFSEYFDFYDRNPGGVNNLCFSASGYLLGNLAIEDYTAFSKRIISSPQNEPQLLKSLRPYAANLVDKLHLDKKRVIAISIAGESGSGKTTLSKLFADILVERGFTPLILHMDDYFILPPKMNHQFRVNDFSLVGPKEVRLHLLDNHIAAAKGKTNASLTVPYMNWITDTEESKVVDITNVNVILVEGTYSTLLKETDHKILINTSYEDTRQSRIKRNRETVTPFIEKVLKKESEIIRSHQDAADMIVDNHWKVVSYKLKSLNN